MKEIDILEWPIFFFFSAESFNAEALRHDIARRPDNGAGTREILSRLSRILPTPHRNGSVSTTSLSIRIINYNRI